jgi:chromosome segregation ATPase
VTDLTAMIPTSATRRMRYSIYLVRKAADLERRITELKNELERKNNDITVLTNQLNKSKAHLDKVSQPYNYLVSAIETKEQQIEKQHSLIITLEKDGKRFREENEKLRFAKNTLERDLEQLLNQKTVVNKLKNVLNEIKSDSKRIDKAMSSTMEQEGNTQLRMLISQLTKNNSDKMKNLIHGQ